MGRAIYGALDAVMTDIQPGADLNQVDFTENIGMFRDSVGALMTESLMKLDYMNE